MGMRNGIEVPTPKRLIFGSYLGYPSAPSSLSILISSLG